MKKIAATAAATLALSLGLLVSPAAAEDAAAPTCEQYLAESTHREGLLHSQIDAFQTVAHVANKDLKDAQRKIVRQRATIKRLRAQLAAQR